MIIAFFIGGPWDGDERALAEAVPEFRGLEQLSMESVWVGKHGIPATNPRKQFSYYRAWSIPEPDLPTPRTEKVIYVYQGINPSLIPKLLVEGYHRPKVEDCEHG